MNNGNETHKRRLFENSRTFSTLEVYLCKCSLKSTNNLHKMLDNWQWLYVYFTLYFSSHLGPEASRLIQTLNSVALLCTSEKIVVLLRNHTLRQCNALLLPDCTKNINNLDITQSFFIIAQLIPKSSKWLHNCHVCANYA